MFEITSKDNRFEAWGIDSRAVALLGARKDAERFGGTVTVTLDGAEIARFAG